MAGNWIKWTKGLTLRREVVVLAAKLKRDRHDIASRLMVLWEWCDDNATDDDSDESLNVSLDLGDKPFDFLDALLGLPGMAEAMASTEVRWLEARSGGRIVFPKLARHNGTSAKTRAYEASKKSRQRKSPVSVPKVSPNHGDKSGTRGEESRGEKEKTLSASPPGVGKLPPERRGKSAEPKPIPSKAREPNPLFDAIAEVSGLSPKTAGSLIGAVCASLASEEPPFTPDEVREFARDFWKHCPYAAKDNRQRPTPKEIEKNINLVRAPPPPPQVAPQIGRTKGEAQDNYAANMLKGIQEREKQREFAAAANRIGDGRQDAP